MQDLLSLLDHAQSRLLRSVNRHHHSNDHHHHHHHRGHCHCQRHPSPPLSAGLPKTMVRVAKRRSFLLRVSCKGNPVIGDFARRITCQTVKNMFVCTCSLHDSLPTPYPFHAHLNYVSIESLAGMRQTRLRHAEGAWSCTMR